MGKITFDKQSNQMMEKKDYSKDMAFEYTNLEMKSINNSLGAVSLSNVQEGGQEL